MSRTSLILGISIALLAGCAPQAPPTAQESAELAALGERWMETFEAGDMDGLVGLYTEDAIFLPPNGELIRGIDGVREHLQALKDTGLKGDLETLEAMVAGDLGYRLGTFTLTTPDGEVADRGKYIEIWRQVGGEWKIASDIYNSDLAAGPAGTYLIGVHEVGDADTWLAAWNQSTERREQFARHGVAGVRTFQGPESANTTGLLIDVVDMDAFQAFLASDEGVAAAAADTVQMDTLTLVTEVR